MWKGLNICKEQDKWDTDRKHKTLEEISAAGTREPRSSNPLWPLEYYFFSNQQKHFTQEYLEDWTHKWYLEWKAALALESSE